MILYTDPKDGKPVHLLVTPFGCLPTKRPGLHLAIITSMVGLAYLAMFGLILSTIWN